MLNKEIILSLKKRAKEMLEGNKIRELSAEEIYTLCCEYEELLDKFNEYEEALDNFMQGKAISTKVLQMEE